ncbi:HAMP domain-containing sensor histidine kinase [Sporosarcina oncorhynchi]|uniref:histidine kinase n=1 Tax=Sporosarcina oncorhynchi TaxID=3056444 RepID=A0ABZ0L4A6_9BACL|nr:HAMP domain-containing sensor histidine kinase [Sporosarcina sp. T2O-4]WOV87426.1 HAMP domain-containing sensor histidine kinase [Sporosarcina sp. T2O-4]
MKLSSKMTVRFILYFLTFYWILFMGTTVIIVMFFSNFLSGFYFHDIRALEKTDVERGIVHQNGTRSFSKPFIDIANRSGGIVQLIDEGGNVLHSTKESLLPESYAIEELIAISKQTGVLAWEMDNEEMLVFLPYTSSDEVLETLEASPSFPSLSKEDEQLLEEQHASFELFDSNGILLHSNSLKEREKLTPVDVLASNSSINEQEELVSFTKLSSGEIAFVRIENPYYQSLAPNDIVLLKMMLNWFIGFHLFLMLFTLGFSLLIGRNYVKPVFYFLKWIERLSNQRYERPNDRTMRTKKNRFKRKYRIYEDIDRSLMRLSENLENNDRTILQTEKLREDWITGLSHDLKTPLSSIYGYANMLSSDHDWTSEEVRGFAKTMVEKSGYMDTLINELTYTYQLKSDGVIFDKTRVNFFTYVSDYVDRSDWKELCNPIGDKEVYVDIDQKRFERVLDNIVGNAVKHTSAGTPVHTEIRTDGGFVVLDVRDEGEGIPVQMLENLFNRYYRGTNTTTDDSGTGLGLTIAQQLVRGHGGEIEVETSAAGTTISVKLPLSSSSG